MKTVIRLVRYPYIAGEIRLEDVQKPYVFFSVREKGLLAFTGDSGAFKNRGCHETNKLRPNEHICPTVCVE